jgi:serine phosphatase RsbU (regulator of sigma subunit)
VVGEDRVTKLPGTGSLPLGVLAGHRHTESSLTLRPGDSLVAFSDGVLDVHPQLDARDAEMEAAAAAVLHGGGSIAEMAERLTTNPQARTEDDVTVVVLRRL